MSDLFRGALPEKFPDALLEEARDLRVAGSYAVAWPRHAVLHAIGWLAKYEFAILGGDVYQVDGQDVYSTYDNWSCNWPGAGRDMEWESYVALSVETAQAYIDMFHRRNGDNYLYSVVVWDEAAYRRHLASQQMP